MTKILQIDREAAALMMIDLSGYIEREDRRIRSGQWDGHIAVETLASHREQATRELVELLEEAKGMLAAYAHIYENTASSDVIEQINSALTKATPDA